MDPDQLTNGLRQLAEFIGHYWNAMKTRAVPVLPDFDRIKPGYLQHLLPNEAPEEAEDLKAILEDVRCKIMPGVTHWQHPDFHAYFPTACSSPAILGDLLGSAIAPVGFTWISCPACTELEVIVLDWMVYAMDLPRKFLFRNHDLQATEQHHGGGTIECSASLACATLTMGLRDRALREHQAEWNASDEERLSGRGPGALVDRMVAYTTEQAHSSVTRACHIAMIRYRIIPTQAIGKRRVFDAKRLAEAIKEDKLQGLIPLLCVATMGTTNACDFDNLEEIGEVCSSNEVWLHVDASYAGSALVCPEFRDLAHGLEYADSFSFNPHKLMLVNFDCSLLWLRDYRILSEAFREDPVYLRHSFEGMPEFKNWSINLGRRFRALKLWFVLRMFGLEKIRALIKQHVQLAKQFEQLLLTDGRFEIVNDVRFGLVCFRLKGSNTLTASLQDALLKERQIYLVAGNVPATDADEEPVYFLRFVCSLQTTSDDVDFAYQALCKTTTELLGHSKVCEPK